MEARGEQGATEEGGSTEDGTGRAAWEKRGAAEEWGGGAAESGGRARREGEGAGRLGEGARKVGERERGGGERVLQSGGRVVVLLGGPGTVGPGMVVGTDMADCLRTHSDILLDNTSYYQSVPLCSGAGNSGAGHGGAGNIGSRRCGAGLGTVGLGLSLANCCFVCLSLPPSRPPSSHQPCHTLLNSVGRGICGHRHVCMCRGPKFCYVCPSPAPPALPPPTSRATRFYTQLGERAAEVSAAIDVFACAADQVGVAEMRGAIEATSGTLVLADSFESDIFAKSLYKLFQRSHEGPLLAATDGVVEVKLPKEIKVMGAVGACGNLWSKAESVSEHEVGQGGTAAWRLCSLSPRSSSLAFFFEIAAPHRAHQIPPGSFALFQAESVSEHEVGQSGTAAWRLCSLSPRSSSLALFFEIAPARVHQIPLGSFALFQVCWPGRVGMSFFPSAPSPPHSSSLALFIEIASPRAHQIPPGSFALFQAREVFGCLPTIRPPPPPFPSQFLTTYRHGDGTRRVRVATAARRWVHMGGEGAAGADSQAGGLGVAEGDGELVVGGVPGGRAAAALAEVVMGFDQEAAAALVAKLAAFKAESEDMSDVLRWLDRMLIRFGAKFGQYSRGDPSSFHLASAFSLFPQFMFHLRRSSFLQVFNHSPDETAFFRLMLTREAVANSLLMVQPALIAYTFESPPHAVLLDVSSLQPDCVLLYDGFFHIVVLHGSTIVHWKHQGFHLDPAHAAF
ncbi:unnamed protein product, partial [Closterium sp. NIES-53]